METTNTTPPTSVERKRQKRVAENSLLVSDDEVDDSFPSFIVVEALNGQPIPLSIFGIQKLLNCAIGNVKSAKKLRNGSVLIEVTCKAQAERALGMTNWVDSSLNPVAIKATPHRSLNSSKGIVRSRDLRDCSDEEVLDALRPSGVVHVKRIMSKKDGTSLPTNTLILTFSKPTPPKFIKAAYLSLSVETFIPNPLRCFNCQKFGHGKNSCTHAAVCARCGKAGHMDPDCQEHPHCVNCSGPHPAFSRDCPEWVKQRSIIQIKTVQNVSFGEAKQLYLQQTATVPTPKSGVSYAAACKACNSISTQTDLTWPIDSNVPISATVSESKQRTHSHKTIETQTTNVDSDSHLGAVGGSSSARPTTSNIPHYQSSTPKQKIQLHNSKPGPASSKQGLGNKFGKGSNDPINIYNRFGSLESMDQEVVLSPSKGSGSRKNR